MASMGDLGKAMKKTAQRVSTNADRLVRRCALAIDAAVVLATPVDTGRARANWQVEVGQAPTGVVLKTDQGGGATIAAGQGAIETYNGEKGGVFITNNLPYIERLNEGWSAQAPAGFVEVAVDVGVQAIISEQAKMVDGVVKTGDKS